MNRIYSLLICLSVVQGSLAQEVNDIKSLPNYHAERLQNHLNVISLQADGLFASNFLDKDMVLKNYWSDQIIQNQISNLKKYNSLGLEANLNLRVSLYKSTIFKKENLSPWFEIGHQVLAGSKLNADLLKLFLQGNAVNKDVSFGDGRVAGGFFQNSQFTFGVTKKDEKQSLTFGLGINIANQYAQGNIKSGSIQTQDDGEIIDAKDLDFEFGSAIGNYPKGFGVAAQFVYRNQMNSNNAITLNIRDLGYVRYNEVENYRPYNRSFSYDGFNLTGFWENGYDINLQDSINGNYIVIDTASSIKITPFKILVGFEHQISEMSFLQFEANYRYMSGYLPMLSASYGQYFKNMSGGRWLVGADIGGFGMAAIKIGADFKLSNKLGLKANISGVESLASANLPVYWRFNTGLFMSI